MSLDLNDLSLQRVPILNTLDCTAIVPCYNEEKTILNVVQTLLESPLVGEVIVVNDGSKDDSVRNIEKLQGQIQIINVLKNKGKGNALSIGIATSKSSLVAFFDADLVNLSQRHIENLMKPMEDKNTKGVIGYPVRDNHSSNPLIYLAGERVYYRNDLLPHLEVMKKTRFGVEVFINSLYDKKDIKLVPLYGLKGLFKNEKRNFSTAIKEYTFEAIEVAIELGRQKGLLQEDIVNLSKLKTVKSHKELIESISKIKDIDIKNLLSRYFVIPNFRYRQIRKKKRSF